MRFRIYTYFEKHPVQKKFAQQWLQFGLPLPERIKRQLVNQIHAEMIVRLMAEVVQNGSLNLEQALKSQYELGQEIAFQTAELLSIQSNDAKSLAKIVDFLHGLLDIGGKKVVVNNAQENICQWTNCPLSGQLKGAEENAGVYYCHLYQEMYKGLLFALNPDAHANTLSVTQSMGMEFCELKTWIG